MFTAAGKKYESSTKLTVLGSKEHRCKGMESYWIGHEKDAYGRDVLHVSMRFPIFDSYDAMYEDRYYHWYFIRYHQWEGFRRMTRLTLVYTEDGRDRVDVTENITPEGCNGSLKAILVQEGWA